jgi:putative two-component system hydrogenase maturation factor HypX/HoxX
MGLLDAAFGADLDEFRAYVALLGERIANDGLYQVRLRDKCRRRRFDERVKPLQAYRDHELARCRECFFGADRSYDEARRRFVYKLGSAGAATPPLDLAARDPELPSAKAA